MTKIAVTLLLLMAPAAHAQTGPNGPWNPRPLTLPYPSSLPGWMPQTLPPGSPGITIPNPYAPPGFYGQAPPGTIPLPR